MHINVRYLTDTGFSCDCCGERATVVVNGTECLCSFCLHKDIERGMQPILVEQLTLDVPKTIAMRIEAMADRRGVSFSQFAADLLQAGLEAGEQDERIAAKILSHIDALPAIHTQIAA